MKKIIIALFLIVNVLFFFGIMKVYEEKDLAYVYQLETQQPGATLEVIAIENNNKELDSQAMFALFKELAQKYDVLISVSQNNPDKNQYNFYLASDENIDERLQLVTDTSVNFNKTDTYYYTSKEESLEGICFYLLNKKLDVNIYPITYLGEMPSATIFFTSTSKQDLEESIGVLMDRFGANAKRYGTASADPYVTEDEIQGFLPVTIVLTLLCALVLMMMYINTKSKKVAIFKTMGTSFAAIGARLFLPLFAMLALTITLTHVLLFSVFVHAVNVRTIPMVLDLAKSGIYQMIGIILVIALSSFLLTLIPTYAMLKNSRLLRYLMNANFVVKIMILLVVLPLVAGNVDIILQNLAVIQYTKNTDVSHYQYVPRYKAKFEVDGYDFRTYIREFGRTQDPNIIYKYDILYEYHHAYQILNQAGAIFCQNSQPYSGVAQITVNENYLKKYPVKDTNGNWIDISQIDADVVSLVPEYYLELKSFSAESFLGDPTDNLKYEVVAIDNQQQIFVFDPAWGYEFLQSPKIVTVYKDTTFRIEISVFHNMFIDGDIEELLKDTAFHGKIFVSTVKESLAESSVWYINEVMDELRLIVPTLALILLMSIQYAYLFLKVFAKQIFVQKILGHNPFRIYGKLLLESSVAVAIALIYALRTGADVRLLLLIMGFEILVYLGVVLFSQNVHAKFLDAGES